MPGIFSASPTVWRRRGCHSLTIQKPASWISSRVRGAFRCQHLFRAGSVWQAAARREQKEIESERRVLEIARAYFVIRQRQHVTGFDTFDRLRPLITRRQQSELAENLAGPKLVVDLGHPVLAF